MALEVALASYRARERRFGRASRDQDADEGHEARHAGGDGKHDDARLQ